MIRAVRALIRFGRYPETRPHRWRAFRAQALKSTVEAVNLVLLSPVFVVMLITWPFAWLHESLRERRFWFPTDPLVRAVAAFYRREHKALNPIFLEARKARGEDITPRYR